MIKLLTEVDFSNWDEEFDFGERWMETIDTIKGATLLSKEEYEKYKDDIKVLYDYNWWLRSPSKDRCAYIVCEGDYLVDNYTVDYLAGAIRPALILEGIQGVGLSIGDSFNFGDETFTILSDNLALCDGIIGKFPFNRRRHSEGSNDYSHSDVKKWVDDWFRDYHTEEEQNL